MRKITSLTLITSAILAFGSFPAHGQDIHTRAIAPSQSIRLWQGAALGAMGNAASDIPTIDVYLPSQNPSRTAVMLCTGAGYSYLSLANEGSSVAAWLNAHGVAAFVLHYRVQPYSQPAPLLDAQRAMRTLRSRAAEFGFAPNHLGVWGFSAGGHVASYLLTAFDSGLASSADTDAIDATSDRPDFGVLAYPVISMLPGTTHPGSHDILLGAKSTPELERQFSTNLHVRSDSPPAFIFATTDDNRVPVTNSLLFYQAYLAAKASEELHLLQHGHHGVGLATTLPTLSHWPDLVASWMTANGWMGTVANEPSKP